MDINDEILINKIESLVEEDDSYWDFSEYKKEHIHGLLTYPATMVPKMQAEILRLILEINPSMKNLLDPFMGSGTIIVEGMLKGLNIHGIDINPLSYLLCLVKTNLVSVEDLTKYRNSLFENLDSENLNFSLITFKGIEKWYRNDMIYDLSKIKYCIELIKDIDIKRFFLLGLCEISRLSNNSRSSTFKLHVKTSESITKFNYDCIVSFKDKINSNIDMVRDYLNLASDKLNNSTPHLKYKYENNLYCGSSVDKLQDKMSFPSNTMDLIITSPPYGDNHTTVTYGQYSVLPLRWINFDDIDINIDDGLIEKLTTIDKLSLGGINYNDLDIDESNILSNSETLSRLYAQLVNDNEVLKAKKVASFIIDFNDVLKQMARILKIGGYIILTVGNRRVNNRVVEFNKIIVELCKLYNIDLIYEFSRNIINKRMPSKISKLKDDSSVESMNKEQILILKRVR